MFEIKCTDCDKTAMVPFKPTVGKSVYCKTCFSKHRKRPQSAGKNSSFDPNKHGHGEEMAGEEERKSPLTFSNRSSAGPTKSGN